VLRFFIDDFYVGPVRSWLPLLVALSCCQEAYLANKSLQATRLLSLFCCHHFCFTFFWQLTVSVTKHYTKISLQCCFFLDNCSFFTTFCAIFNNFLQGLTRKNFCSISCRERVYVHLLCAGFLCTLVRHVHCTVQSSGHSLPYVRSGQGTTLEWRERWCE